jgi:hypothetical protein
VNLKTLDSSFLYRRLRFGDPYHRLRKPTRNPLHPYRDFAEDRGFRADLAVLKKAKVPLLMIHLPTYEEIKAGGYVGSDRQKELMGSLERAVGIPVFSLTKPMSQLGEELESYFLLPEDQHPSARGAEAYATAIAEFINDIRVSYDAQRDMEAGVDSP